MSQIVFFRSCSMTMIICQQLFYAIWSTFIKSLENVIYCTMDNESVGIFDIKGGGGNATISNSYRLTVSKRFGVAKVLC